MLDVENPQTYLLLSGMFLLLAILWFLRPWLIYKKRPHFGWLLFYLLPCVCFAMLWIATRLAWLDMGAVDRCFQRQKSFGAKLGCFLEG